MKIKAQPENIMTIETTIRNNKMIKSFILMVFLLLSITLTATAQNERASRWNHSDGSTDLSVTMRNNVRFSDDYTDVSSIDGDGSLEVLERREMSFASIKNYRRTERAACQNLLGKRRNASI